ncbi:MAG: MG2 domain-containing protein [Bacteroidota bacterium]
MTRFLFVSLALLLSFEVHAQPPADELKVVLDRPFYVLGEDIWYQIIAADRKLEEIQSKIVHVEWIDPDGKVVRHQKLRLHPGVAAGDLAIPEEWKPGVYQMRAYTHWNLNYDPVPMIELNLPIYALPDAEDMAQIQGIIDETEVTPLAIRNQSEGLKLTLSADTISFREAIQCQLELDESTGQPIFAQLAVQVNHMDQIGLEGEDWKEEIGGNASWKEGEMPIPAEEKMKVHLEVRTGGTNQPHTTGFLEAIVQETRYVFYGRSEEGKAVFEAENLIGPATLQCFDVNPFELKTTLNVLPGKKEVPVPTPEPAQAELSWNPTVARYLVSKLEEKAMLGLFGKASERSAKQAPTVKEDWPIRQQYEIGKYVQFEDLFHFTSEAVLSVANRKDKSGVLGDPRNHQYIFVRTFTKTGAEIDPEVRDNRPVDTASSARASRNAHRTPS